MIPRRAVRACAVAATVFAVGCSGSGADGGGAGDAPRRTLPLTGETADVVPDRAVLAVKVDNTEAARPQRGLASADLVVEQMVEGGLTRLAVLYHSRLPDIVRPVRSVRTSDSDIVAPTGGLLAASGGAGIPLAAVADAGIRTVLPPDAAFSRDRSGRPPYNLVLRPAGLETALADLPMPPDYLPWAGAGDPPPAGAPATTARLRFSPAHTTSWTYDGSGAWTRDDELAAPGDVFSPTTVLVLRVRVTDAGYRDSVGSFVPETVLEGSGDAVVLHRGTAVEARWDKADAQALLHLTLPTGEDLRVPAGRTWIALVPQDGGVSVDP